MFRQSLVRLPGRPAADGSSTATFPRAFSSSSKLPRLRRVLRVRHPRLGPTRDPSPPRPPPRGDPSSVASLRAGRLSQRGESRCGRFSPRAGRRASCPWAPRRRMTTSPTTTCSMCAKRPCTRASERSRPILTPRPRTSRMGGAVPPRRAPPVPSELPSVSSSSSARARRLRLTNLRRKRAFSDVLRPHPQTPADDRERGTPRLRTRAAGGGASRRRRRRQ